jgi:hypothetical protein
MNVQVVRGKRRLQGDLSADDLGARTRPDQGFRQVGAEVRAADAACERALRAI